MANRDIGFLVIKLRYVLGDFVVERQLAFVDERHDERARQPFGSRGNRHDSVGAKAAEGFPINDPVVLY